MFENYSPLLQKVLKRNNLRLGDRISVDKGRQHYEGLLMPRTQAGSADCIVLKLDNGYNIGIKFERGVKIEKIRNNKTEATAKSKTMKQEKIKADPTKPTVAILATGGTIASRVDYRSGGVVPITKAEELVSAIPELQEIANLKTKIVFSMFSEDMQLEHHSLLAKEIAKTLDGVDGIVVTHGTDTMHYTAAMLSFMLQQLSKPVVLVGSQRSSDRGSSDAAMNLICAVQFAAKANAAGVFVCMHENESDKTCLIHSGVATRKMHTNRRDAFKSINAKPIARVNYNGKIEFLSSCETSDKNKKVVLASRFEKKVALIKLTPNFDPELIKFFINKKYKGLILEGTGLGHAPINSIDRYTKQNRQLFFLLEQACKKMIVGMTSQCIYGRVNMNVYSTGRDLQRIGVVPCEMLSEVAFVKLAWLLGNNPKQARELLNKNSVGEIAERSEE